ncbi:MAG: hypothetical protein ABI672_02130 [Vicinamibacteria bacterium]
MERRNLRLVTFVALWLAPALVGAQDLAAAAAKEKARRKQLPASSGKVYTDRDVAGHEDPAGDPGTAQTETAGARPGGAGAPVRAAAPARGTGTGSESAWQARAASARANIVAAEANYADVVSKANSQAANGTPKGTDCNIPASVVRQGTEAMKRWSCQQSPVAPNLALGVEPARRAVVAAKEALRRLEDDARRAGVPAGWLR